MAVPTGAGRRKAFDFDTAMLFSKGASMARAMSPSASEATSRSSFSSVRENDDGLAQTFTRSKISSYIETPEDVFDDESPSAEEPLSSTSSTNQSGFQAPPLTQPNSRLHGFWYPAQGFRGWREIPIKGKTASRSCEDLHKMHMTWDKPAPLPTTAEAEAHVDADGDVLLVPAKMDGDVYPTSTAPLERLPSEVLGKLTLISSIL